ncbi:MAG: MarR family transcriptional regulator [Muribaculaceae bacterium]|nr:MarR family transcriptional regulator [Muribaculaceae bacterium]
MKRAGLFDTLGVELDHTFTLLVGTLNHALREVGVPLNHAQFVMLKRIAANDGISQIALARSLGKDAAGISRSLKSLEQYGYVERRPLSGSKNGVFLTDKARADQSKIRHAITLATEKGCRGMTPEEYKAGIEFLLRIQTNLQTS